MIYKILPNLRQFKQFTLDQDEIEETLGEDCLIFMDARPTRYQDIWKTLHVTFFDEFPDGSDIKQRPEMMPDFLGKLFVNQRAHDVLAPLLTVAGEWLPVSIGSEHGFIFNPLLIAEDRNAVDNGKVIRDQWDALVSPAFVDSKLQSAPIFRTALDDYRGIYCTSELKRAVEQAGLKGVTFSEDLRDRPPE